MGLYEPSIHKRSQYRSVMANNSRQHLELATFKQTILALDLCRRMGVYIPCPCIRFKKEIFQDHNVGTPPRDAFFDTPPMQFAHFCS